MLIIPKPQSGEYAPYAVVYIDLVPESTSVLSHLQACLEDVRRLVQTLPEESCSVPFAAGEWTVKEILGHIMDQERVFAYRALRFARNDPTELPTFDHDVYVMNSNANDRSLEALLEEYATIRESTLTLFGSLGAEALTRSGKVGGHPTSVRGLAWLIAGHEAHHINSIRQNYLGRR